MNPDSVSRKLVALDITCHYCFVDTQPVNRHKIRPGISVKNDRRKGRMYEKHRQPSV